MLYETLDEKRQMYDERCGVGEGAVVRVRTGLIAGRFGFAAGEESAEATAQQHEIERAFDEFVMFPVGQQATYTGLDTGAFTLTSSPEIVKPGLLCAGGVEQLDDGMGIDVTLWKYSL